MLIVCPSCASSYELSAEQLGAGRMLRCAKCRETWHATPADAQAPPIDSFTASRRDIAPATDEPPVAAEPEVVAMDAPLVERPKRGLKLGKTRKNAGPSGKRKPGARGLRLAPAHAAAAALVLTAIGAVTFRTQVVKALPQTARLYASAGMPVNLRGLEFSGLRSELLIDKDKAVLLVEGEIKGVASTETEVPKVTVSLRGPEGRELYAWTSDVGRATLAKGETTTFHARLASPPAEGRDVVVRFAENQPHATAH